MHQIMEQERGASLRLLFQLKLACQKIGVNTADPDEMSMTNLKNGKIHQVLMSKNEKTMEMSKSIPPPTVGGKDIRTNKQKLADKRSIGFDVNQKLLFDSALATHEAEMQFIKSITQQQRNNNITKLLENQTFMKNWTQEGKQDWKLNQTKRSEAIAKVKYFEDREVTIYKAKLQNEQIAATSEEIQGISDFEKNLQKLGIQQGISMDEAVKKQEEKKGIPPGQIQNFSYAATMNKIKETKKNSDFAGKERDRRRRKMIVDQQNAQTSLDLQAQEAALIKKLLKQTSEDQKDSYCDKRMEKCKQNEFLMRKNDALSIEEKRNIQNQKAEETRKLSLKEIDAERARQNELRKIEGKKKSFAKKMEKRAVNIEIASGLVDLILDLADETFDIVSTDKDHQIQNPEWRNFIKIFKSGKKVSLRNIEQNLAVVDKDQLSEGLQIADDLQAHEIQKQYWNEASMLNFYEYLSGSGAFNIPQLEPVLWHKYEQQYGPREDGKKTIPFIDYKLQENGDLVKMIDKIYESTIQPQIHQDKRRETLLQQPTFKIALVGRAYSGKKTVAKQIQELLGNDVTILNIEEIIKEAFEYINPKKAEESVIIDPKLKGKGSKMIEPVIVDIFEGKNTTHYKSIAQQIKEQFFLNEIIPKNNLAEQVLDDHLLNQLVVERLKILSDGRTIRGPEQIKAGVAREFEILKQLEEIEHNASHIALDPKSKAPKIVKGGPDPEKLQKELDEIRSFKANGWILIGYPKKLSQIKLLEQEMTGFIAKIDKPKSEQSEIRASWRQIITDDTESEVFFSKQQVFPSGFDSIVFIDTPDSEVNRRASVPTEEAGIDKKIVQMNENFDNKVGSIKKWSEQFGLVDNNGVCRVTLGQEVKVNEWDKKDQVKEAVYDCVKKVLAFKQIQFDEQRQIYKEQIFQMQRSKSNLLEPTVGSNHLEQKSRDISAILPDQNDKTIDSVIIFDKKSTLEFNKGSVEEVAAKSQTGTSKAKKQIQQRFEINETQKIHKWEAMLNSYYRQSLLRFDDLVKQRDQIFSLFAETQSSFFNFINRQPQYQKRVNEFCDNYNRFNEQYPDLRGKQETRTELLKRVSILNDNLWQIILERKNEAVIEQDRLAIRMDNGWESREKSKLITLVSQLMEYEFDRLSTIVHVASGWVLNQDIDLVSLCQKLDERNTSTFEYNAEGDVICPMLESVISYLHNVISQLFQDAIFTQSSPLQQKIMMKESANFHLRCNTLKSYAILLLVEFNKNTKQINEAFEKWIILSVKRENAVCSAVIKKLRGYIQNDSKSIENVKLQNIDLDIERVQLAEGQPNYVTQNVSGLQETRIDIQTLTLLYSQFKENSYEELLDSTTFIQLLIGIYQSYRVPQRWRNLQFQAIQNLVTVDFRSVFYCNSTKFRKMETLAFIKGNENANSLSIQKKTGSNIFAAKPLSNDFNAAKTFFGKTKNERTIYVNWKKIFVLFALAASPIPSEEKLYAYAHDLNNYGLIISLENFQNADAWFDSTESTNTESQMLKESSANNTETSEIQEDEVFDTIRLKQLKELIWHSIKRTNEDGIRGADLIQVVKDIRAMCTGKELLFGDILG